MSRRSRSSQTAGESESLPHSLVPLSLAAEVVRARVYAERSLSPNGREDLLNSIASTLMTMATLYEYGANPDRPPQPLLASDIRDGIFRGGGRELHFIDGRRPRRFLAIRAADVTTTIEALKHAQQEA